MTRSKRRLTKEWRELLPLAGDADEQAGMPDHIRKMRIDTSELSEADKAALQPVIEKLKRLRK